MGSAHPREDPAQPLGQSKELEALPQLERLCRLALWTLSESQEREQRFPNVSAHLSQLASDGRVLLLDPWPGS